LSFLLRGCYGVMPPVVDPVGGLCTALAVGDTFPMLT